MNDDILAEMISETTKYMINDMHLERPISSMACLIAVALVQKLLHLVEPVFPVARK
jgi:hypothetical protein